MIISAKYFLSNLNSWSESLIFYQFNFFLLQMDAIYLLLHQSVKNEAVLMNVMDNSLNTMLAN